MTDQGKNTPYGLEAGFRFFPIIESLQFDFKVTDALKL
jgi:hypothetical protein